MPLINVPDIQQDDAATPELWNSRYGTVVDLLNGNLDADNFANNGVTTAKLNTGSVTTAKIASAAVTPVKWTNPYKFSAYRNAAWTSGLNTFGTIIFDTEVFDTNNNFDTSTGTYTAPVTGFYQLNWWAQATVTSGSLYDTQLFISGGVSTGANGSGQVQGGATVGGFSCGGGTFYLNAGSTCTVGFYGSGGAGNTGSSTTGFSGFLVSET